MYVFLLTLLILPSVVLAQETGFVPLVGIPFVETSQATNISDYVNSLYLAAISIAAFLAVVKIIFAGVQYMLSEVVTDKEQAKKSIYGAVIGLLIVLGAFLILNTINPQLTSLRNLDEGPEGFREMQAERRERPEQNDAIITGPTDCADNETFQQGIVNNSIERRCVPNAEQNDPDSIIPANVPDADQEEIKAVCGTNGEHCGVEALPIVDGDCLQPSPDGQGCLVYNTTNTMSVCEDRNGYGVQNPSNPGEILCYTENSPNNTTS